jgi:hypothetical protein
VDFLIGALVVFGGFAVVFALFALLAARIRRRGVGGSLMGPIDEIYHPSAHRYRAEIREYEQRAAPAPNPGGNP